jgi:alanine dehydrogenase
MDIGLPRERMVLKTLPFFGEEVREGRVALTPQGVRELAAKGHRVYVERGAGERAGFPDALYEAAGARLVSREEAFGRGEVVLSWTYAASTCTGNRGLKSRLSLPAMSLRRHW